MRIIITTVLLLIAIIGFAQDREVGVFGGITTFSGDLTDGMVDFKSINIGYGAYYRFYTSPKFSFKAAIQGGTFTGDDANSSTTRVNRGYSFKSSIYDASVTTEWNILGINISGSSAVNQSNFSPYLLFGIGAAFVDATPTANNADVPLSLYDSSQEYPRFTMVVPMGIGFKYTTEMLSIGIEGSIRAGLSDFLDGISRSADPLDNDWYGMYGITVGYRLGAKSTGASRSSDTPEDSETGSILIRDVY